MSTSNSGLYQTCAITDDPTFVCTPQTCCLAQGQLMYLPTLAGNSLYAAIFGIILIISLSIGLRYRTLSFTTWMIIGLIGEIVGYIGRIILHNNIFSFNAFLTYLIPLTISPAFLTACIYLCLARIIHVVDPYLSITRLKPRTCTAIFVTSDFICLVLQGAGGGVAATNHIPGDRLGENIMIAGLALQVVSILSFMALCCDFAWRLRRSDASYQQGKCNMASPSENHLHALANVRDDRMFRGFVVSLAVATSLILIRSIYRLAELQGGFRSKIANNEVSFTILEGPMIIISVLVLTVFHPGLSLGRRGLWNMKAFQTQSGGGKGMRLSEESAKMVPMVTVASTK